MSPALLSLKKTFLLSVAFVAFTLVLGWAYASFGALSSVNVWDTLKKADWNLMVSDLTDLDARVTSQASASKTVYASYYPTCSYQSVTAANSDFYTGINIALPSAGDWLIHFSYGVSNVSGGTQPVYVDFSSSSSSVVPVYRADAPTSVASTAWYMLQWWLMLNDQRIVRVAAPTTVYFFTHAPVATGISWNAWACNSTVWATKIVN